MSCNNDAAQWSSLNLGAMASGDQFEYFVDELCRVYNPCDYGRDNNRSSFPAHFNYLQRGHLSVALSQTPDYRIEINKNQTFDIENAPLYIVHVLEGQAGLCYNGSCYQAGAGSMLVCDTTKALNMEFLDTYQKHTAIVFALPNEQYQDRNTRRELLNERRFAQHSLAPLLKMSMHQLGLALKSRNEEQSIRLASAAESLVSIIAHDENAFSGAGITDSQILHLVDMETERLMYDPAFTIDQLAGSIKLSKRRVQRAMKGRGTTFSDFLREKRLRLGLARLQDPAFAGNSIAEIAFSCGYSDQSSFHRAFKTRFGMTPADARAVSP